MYDKYKALEAQYAQPTYIQMLCTSAGCLRESKSQHGLKNKNAPSVCATTTKQHSTKTKGIMKDHDHYHSATTAIYVTSEVQKISLGHCAGGWLLVDFEEAFCKRIYMTRRERDFVSAPDVTLFFFYLRSQDISLL